MRPTLEEYSQQNTPPLEWTFKYLLGRKASTILEPNPHATNMQWVPAPEFRLVIYILFILPYICITFVEVNKGCIGLPQTEKSGHLPLHIRLLENLVLHQYSDYRTYHKFKPQDYNSDKATKTKLHMSNWSRVISFPSNSKKEIVSSKTSSTWLGTPPTRTFLLIITRNTRNHLKGHRD